ncbi:uncharacterized protein KQ657_001736 [Scheffersomyces spartinae]|uniref:Uncharacterized protein n=1 Tax=Scheffersomyces spartinae TaxID=45513 RepID=A0A9P7V6L8_9ASCO|nr:uncharacterized protein KQ657_001736 [Scheffersomyces spartinae]KAG7192338.1 hypothetical protein KQ657_001736 [Scheffersomyces spartinae]
MQLLLLILLVAIGLPLLTSRKKKPRKRSCLENVTPVDVDFDWKTQEPLKVRPFVNKKSFNPSMNLTDFTANDWILIEKTYLQNVQLRREITIKHSDHTVFLNPDKRFVAAFHEFYSLVIHYLTHRYPQYFVPDKHNNVVKNLITEDQIPLDPNIITKDSVLEQDHNRELLLSLARTIEEDFILLHKDAPDEEYIMRCNVSGFPAGFDPKNNFDKPISFIHTPVPQYQKRLKVSMSKYFDRLTTDEAHVRHNWSIQTNASKFTLHSHHGREGETPPPPLKMEDIDFEKGCFLRCERQCFTRLPVLGANLMTIRTYVTPLSEIKHLEDDHVTRELIRGIDSLPEDLAFYKKRGAWGEAVKEYLRS